MTSAEQSRYNVFYPVSIAPPVSIRFPGFGARRSILNCHLGEQFMRKNSLTQAIVGIKPVRIMSELTGSCLEERVHAPAFLAHPTEGFPHGGWVGASSPRTMS